MLDSRTQPPACAHCGGLLHQERDQWGKRLVCFQCGRSPDPRSQEQIVDLLPGAGGPERRPWRKGIQG